MDIEINKPSAILYKSSPVIEFSSLDNVGCDARSLSLSSRSQAAFNADLFSEDFRHYNLHIQPLSDIPSAVGSVSMS